MSKKPLTIADCNVKFVDNFNKLSDADKHAVNNFLTLREMTYSEYQKLSEEGQKYIDSLFPIKTK